MSAEALGDRDFLDAFESGTLPEGAFHHRDHVRLAWLYLQRLPPAAALARFSDGLRRFASSVGKSGLYHETITWAYLLLIRERMERAPGRSWAEFARSNPDPLTWKPSILEAYYRRETLESDLARKVFLLPDRLASPWPLSAAPPRADPEGPPPSR